MEIIIILILILLNGLFSMSEMSLVASKRFKLELSSKKGHSGAKKALELADNPTKFLSTVQIGITLIGILLGVYSGENLTQDIQVSVESNPYLEPYAHEISTSIVVIFITYLSIVLGELIPKRIGMSYPEGIITVLAKPMWVISIITSPFVWLLTQSNNIILSILGIKNQSDNAVSEAEIRSIVRESAEEGEIQEIEQDIVERVFEMGDRKVSSLLTHRRNVVFFKIDDTWQQISDKIQKEKHSAYPVTSSDNLDDIVGIVLIKDLFSYRSDTPFSLKSYISEPIYIHENMHAFEVLQKFKEKRIHYAMVLDEYGVINGIVTMDDVMDALIGDSSERHQKQYSIIKRDERSWLVDGQYKLAEFVKFFDLYIEEDILNHTTTVAGLFIQLYGHIPEVGDTQTIDNYLMEIVDLDGSRIDKILLTKL